MTKRILEPIMFKMLNTPNARRKLAQEFAKMARYCCPVCGTYCDDLQYHCERVNDDVHLVLLVHNV